MLILKDNYNERYRTIYSTDQGCRSSLRKYGYVAERGLTVDYVGDRRLALIDENNVVITQRKTGHSGVGDRGNPELTLVEISLLRDNRDKARGIRAAFPGHGSIDIDPQAASDETVSVLLHRKYTPVHLVKSTADAWFSNILGRSVRLVNQTDEDIRQCDPNFTHGMKHENSLGDGFQILLTTVASLNGLNKAIPGGGEFTMRNFRPNIVVRGSTDHAENGWGMVKIGNAKIELVKPCTRCEVTTNDLKTGQQPSRPARSDPWATLNKLWHVDYKVGGGSIGGELINPTHVFGPVFGENGMPVRTGFIKVGNPVIVTKGKRQPQWQPR